MKKFVLIALFSLSATALSAQMYRFQQSANVSFGGFVSDIGGGARIGYSYLWGNGLFLSPQILAEWGRPHQARFSSYGADLGLGYSPFWFSNSFIFNLRASGTVLWDALTGLDKRIKGIDYGVRGGAELEYYVVPQAVSLTAYGNQVYLLKNTFGRSRYEIGVMLKFSLGR